MQCRFLKQQSYEISYGDLSPSNRGRLLKKVAAPPSHVFDEDLGALHV